MIVCEAPPPSHILNQQVTEKIVPQRSATNRCMYTCRRKCQQFTPFVCSSNSQGLTLNIVQIFPAVKQFLLFDVRWPRKKDYTC